MISKDFWFTTNISFWFQRLEIKEAMAAMQKQRNMTPVAEVDGDVDKLTKENEMLGDKVQKVKM